MSDEPRASPSEIGPPRATLTARVAGGNPTLVEGGGCARVWRGGLPGPAVGDRRAAVAAEGLRRQANSRRGLPPLVLGAVDQRERALDDVGIEAVLRELLARA